MPSVDPSRFAIYAALAKKLLVIYGRGDGRSQTGGKNSFKFNGKFYAQVAGTAMGTKMAPNYAILYMADFEQSLLAKPALQPLCWWRFIDDIFLYGRMVAKLF